MSSALTEFVWHRLGRIKKYVRIMVDSPTVRACVIMTFALCSTFIGYEYARAASITLLADEVRRFGVCALSLGFIYVYLFVGNWTWKRGPSADCSRWQSCQRFGLVSVHQIDQEPRHPYDTSFQQFGMFDHVHRHGCFLWTVERSEWESHCGGLLRAARDLRESVVQSTMGLHFHDT